MKECNECVRDCNPIGKMLMSNEPCPNYQKDHFFFDFADHISKISISDPNNELISYFLKYAK